MSDDRSKSLPHALDSDVDWAPHLYTSIFIYQDFCDVTSKFSLNSGFIGNGILFHWNQHIFVREFSLFFGNQLSTIHHFV